jgi:thiol-disulfide isomerase/thioredoxin
MRQRVATILLSLLSGLWLVPADRAMAEDRSPAEILKELDQVKLPTVDHAKLENDAYGRGFTSRREKAIEKRAALILEFYKAAPEHEKIPALMFERWDTLITLGKRSRVANEIHQVLAKSSNAKLKREAAFERVRLEINDAARSGVLPVQHINEYIKLERKLKSEDVRGPLVLWMASKQVRDGEARLEIENRILKEFPTSAIAERLRKGQRRQTAIGKPFNLEFKDAINGSHVSIRQLRGKIVVIDFWASWCSPCLQELPSLKELYAKYREFGVEFIGVSLDYPANQGGLEALKKCVAAKGISWPQYYQGHAFEGEFSKSCGVFAVPSVFVIDPAGNVYSTEARGKLETIIPELIEARAEGKFSDPVYQPKSRTRRNPKPN